jgi:hypothetical protein
MPQIRRLDFSTVLEMNYAINALFNVFGVQSKKDQYDISSEDVKISIIQD